MPPTVVYVVSVWMESRVYWGIDPRQWPADEGGTPNVSKVEWLDDSYDNHSSFFFLFLHQIKTKKTMKTQKQLKEMIHGTAEYQDMTVEDIADEVCEYFTARYAATKRHGQFGDVLTAALDFLPKSWAEFDIFSILYDWCKKAVHTDHRGMKSSTGMVDTLDWYVIE